MITREKIIAEARSWKGTPFRHQAARKGVGCDCKGLVSGIANALQMPEGLSLAATVRDYPKHFAGRRMFDGLMATLTFVPVGEPGDVVAILMGRDPFPRHLGILTERPGWMIHTYGGGVRRVTETPIGHWRIHSYWSWPSLGGRGG